MPFMTSNWQLKCWNSRHIHNNSVLHYLYNMAVGHVIPRPTFNTKAKSSRPTPENTKANKLGLKAKDKD